MQQAITWAMLTQFLYGVARPQWVNGIDSLNLHTNAAMFELI